MGEVKAHTVSVVVIGDLVDSRLAPDRQALHDALTRALDRANDALGERSRSPLRVTVGDEFQGTYAALGPALEATFRVRAELHPADVRFGVARGATYDLDPEHDIEDGPGFWAARSAIETTESVAGRAALRHTRTTWHSDLDSPDSVTAVNAALLSLDALVGSMSAVSRRILSGRLEGRTQAAIAEELRLSPSAVSQRVIRDGIGAALETMGRLHELS